jgi:hypothetical protein
MKILVAMDVLLAFEFVEVLTVVRGADIVARMCWLRRQVENNYDVSKVLSSRISGSCRVSYMSPRL